MLLAATLFLLWAGAGAASLDGAEPLDGQVQPDGRVGRYAPPLVENGQMQLRSAGRRWPS